MGEWTKRQLAVAGALLAMTLIAGLALGASWATDVWTYRAQIHDSAEATCADPDKDCAQKDLPAQVRAATAAEAMVDLTFWQVILGGFGVIIGGATLAAAASAAHWARDAAVHTKRSADVAEKAFQTADVPHVLVKEIGVGRGVQSKGEGDLRIRSYCRVSNYGRGIGWIKGFGTRIAVISADRQRVFGDDSVDPVMESHHWPLPPNNWWGTKDGEGPEFVLSAKDRDEISSGKSNLYILGKVIFAGLEGPDRTHRFVYKYNRRVDRMAPFHEWGFWSYE